MIENRMSQLLKRCTFPDELRTVLKYALFPPGKLFRPNIVKHLCMDFNKSFTDNFIHLACALEFHHAYTLVHDDLPAMDNDEYRRGKLSTHARFGEWKAILAGDALLIASFQELTQIQSHHLADITKFFSWATGGRGLISGQYNDLASSGKLSFSEIMRVHELKTGRLIQVATVGTYLLSCEKTFSGFKDFLRLGKAIGLCFQLLDDLTELTENHISSHEEEINPFISNFEKSFNELSNNLKIIERLMKKYRLHHFSQYMKSYYQSNKMKFFENKNDLLKSPYFSETDFLKLNDLLTIL